MKVLFLAEFCIEPSVGGIQRVTDSLAKELMKRGNSVFFLSVKWGPFISNFKTSAPQFYVDIEHASDWKYQVEKIIRDNQIKYIINQMPGKVTNHLLKELSIDVKVISVFHTQPFLNDYITRRQILRFRVYTLKQRCFKIISFIFPGVRKRLIGKYEVHNILDTLEVSNKVCFISERFFSRVLKHIPEFPKHKLTAINNPNTFIGSANFDCKKNQILWVGRVENGIKNTIDFVKIWEKLYLLNPSWHALIAGEGGDLPLIKRYVKRKAIKNIEIIGRCDNIEYLYQQSKIIVVTSFSESWNMALTEGMTYGCVPCAYDTYETVHDIISKENGFLSKPKPREMANKIQMLMSNDKLCKDLSNKARESVKRFSVERIVDQWIDLFHSIL